MRTVLRASLRAHTRRHVAALVAVTIAVAFVVVVDALGSGARAGVAASVEAAYSKVDLVVGEDHGVAENDLDRVLEVARERGDRTAVVASTWTAVTGPAGRLGDDVQVGTVALDPALRWQRVAEGRAPQTDREALVAADTAEAKGIEVGDRLTVGTGVDTVEVTVVGLTQGSSYLDADVDIPWPAMDELAPAFLDAVAYDVRDGDVAGAAETLTSVVDSAVRTRDAYVADRIVLMNQGIDVLAYVLLLFATVAGFVAVLVIANTFTILFAQRSRDFALLRCVGATRRQVVRSVRAEALVLAVVAGVAGVVTGVLAGRGLGVLIRSLAGETTFGAVSHSPVWVAAAFLGGVVATVLAAWWPTRAVVRVSPLTALRPADAPSTHTDAGRVRIALGLLTVALGSLALALAVASGAMVPLLVGGVVSFVGVLLLGPVTVPLVLRGLGRLGRSGGAVRIAAANAVRNPRRSAATTASLLVGVTLATAILVGTASARDAVTAELDAEYPVDVALTAHRPFDADLVASVAAAAGVGEVRAVPGARVSTEVGPLIVVAPSDADRAVTRDPSTTRADTGEVLVPAQVAQGFEEGVPEQLTLRTESGTVTVETRVVGARFGRAVVVAPEALARLAPTDDAPVLWVLAEDGTDAEELAGALGALTRGTGAEIDDNLAEQQWVARQLDVLVWTVLGLLGVGVLIALVGIASTVGLSILERSREHALLRALGLTRCGLRRVLAAEGMLLSVVAALLGTAIGLVYAWFGVEAIIVPSVGSGGLVVPWTHLVAVLVVASSAGLAASTVPARRGARITPAEGLSLD